MRIVKYGEENDNQRFRSGVEITLLADGSRRHPVP